MLDRDYALGGQHKSRQAQRMRGASLHFAWLECFLQALHSQYVTLGDNFLRMYCRISGKGATPARAQDQTHRIKSELLEKCP